MRRRLACRVCGAANGIARREFVCMAPRNLQPERPSNALVVQAAAAAAEQRWQSCTELAAAAAVCVQ